MQVRKRRVRLIYIVIVAVLYAAAILWVTANRDSIVIAQGIVRYRSIRQTVLIIGGAVTALTVLLYILDWAAQRRWQQQYDRSRAQRETEEEERLRREKQDKETLNVRKDMDSLQLRKILTEYGTGRWSDLSKELLQLRIQLDMMDEQQEKLSRLLRNNGADALSNTEDVLNEVEQYLCKSVRKVINYMDVANPSNPSDTVRVREQVEKCHADLQQQLQQVQEFLFAMADYLNSQGDDDNSMQMLEIYKATIMNSIRD